ncbi:hypothetical protein ACCO45_009887 [Purpureocillium lilacinum]|uniref:Uncharacterized protein n=2 Tax=Purpureocillium lilacinum TaxID=33203 RepID=A0ACC4DKL2_PURLI
MFGFATPPGSHDGQCAYGNGFFRREATPKLDTPPTGYKEAPLRSSGYRSNSIHQHVSAVREPPLLISRRDSQDNAPNYAKDTPTSCEVFRDLPAGALGLERSRLGLLEPTVPGRPGAKANTQQNLSLHRVSEVDKLQDIVFSELMGMESSLLTRFSPLLDSVPGADPKMLKQILADKGNITDIQKIDAELVHTNSEARDRRRPCRRWPEDASLGGSHWASSARWASRKAGSPRLAFEHPLTVTLRVTAFGI